MDRLIKNLHWIVILILLIMTVIFYEIGASNKRALQEEKDFNNAKAIRDSILVRQVIRAKDEAAFKYRDSLRQERINYILLKNEKSRKKTIIDIKRVADADDATRDSLWINSWAVKDSFPF